VDGDEHYGYPGKIRRRECYDTLEEIITRIMKDYCQYTMIGQEPALLTTFFRDNAGKTVVLAIVRSRHVYDLVYKMKDTRPGTDNWFYEPRFLARFIKVWMTESECDDDYIRSQSSADESRYDSFAEMVANNFFRRNFPGAAYQEDVANDSQLIQYWKDKHKFVEAIVAEVTSVATWVYSPGICNSYFNSCFPAPDESDPEYDSPSVSSRSIGHWLRNLICHKIEQLNISHAFDLTHFPDDFLSRSPQADPANLRRSRPTTIPPRRCEV